MSDRIKALREAVDAYAKASGSAAALSTILDQIGNSPEELTNRLDDVDGASADLLLAAEQIRSAIHRFQDVASRAPYFGILKHDGRKPKS